ncbi:MAG: hypothetical protein M0P12_03415 [Paludibacteraceae bacterium]|jgi:hypothetical protein|nr:hypothetical protein [Paludibacteraceae bacterium]HOI27614.1 hypothetical protein [Paludibacteraceae bacterium]HOU67434.1 hypothetical protein [Paludibacteraceae bacterium]HQF49474.1 hypothetical protein [Paludibacteraceae bacterium]HQJ89609.1 hypothetical protein [Paludibacteraceae bacterium]
MKKVILFCLSLGALLMTSCSPAAKGKSAGEEYCDCNQEDGILSVAKCKKDVLSGNKEDLLNEEFQDAFWTAVSDCDK